MTLKWFIRKLLTHCRHTASCANDPVWEIQAVPVVSSPATSTCTWGLLLSVTRGREAVAPPGRVKNTVCTVCSQEVVQVST